MPPGGVAEGANRLQKKYAAVHGPSLKTILGDEYSEYKSLLAAVPDERRLEFERRLPGLLVLLHHKGVNLPSGSRIDLYRHESHERLFKLPLKEARKRVERARGLLLKLRQAIDALPALPGGIFGIKPRAELEAVEHWLDDFDGALSQTGPQKMPDFNRKVEAIVRCVFEHTGKFHDKEVALLLSVARPPGYPNFPTAESLKTWRSERGLTERKVSQKSQNS